MTELVTTFHRLYPGMAVNVSASFTPAETVEMVRSGVAEIGLLGSAGRPPTADLNVCQLESQPLVLISPPGTDDGCGSEGGGTIDRKDLDGLDFVISPRGSLMRQLIDDALVDDVSTSVIAEVEHRTSLLPLVCSQVGHTVMPNSWRESAENCGCVVREIAPAVHLDIFVVSRSGDLTPGAQAMLELIYRSFRGARHRERT